MLSNFLNLDGVTVLDKKQQNKVRGGYQLCIVTIDGVSDKVLMEDGEAGSRGSNALCVAVIRSGNGGRCSYDCAYDGFGH